MIPFVIVLRQLNSHSALTVFVFLLWLTVCLFVKVWYVRFKGVGTAAATAAMAAPLLPAPEKNNFIINLEHFQL